MLLAIALAGDHCVAGSKSRGKIILTGEAPFRRCSKLNLAFDTCRGIFESFTATDRGYKLQIVKNHYYIVLKSENSLLFRVEK